MPGNIYNAPGATNEQITQINNILSDLQASLLTCQMGIVTDKGQLAFKNHVDAFFRVPTIYSFLADRIAKFDSNGNLLTSKLYEVANGVTVIKGDDGTCYYSLTGASGEKIWIAKEDTTHDFLITLATAGTSFRINQSTGQVTLSRYTSAGFVRTDATGLLSTAPLSVSDLPMIYWMPPVLDFYDPTSGTPSGPSIGERYISLATANEWTKDNIYEWNGSIWIQTSAVNGLNVYIRFINWQYTYNNGGWLSIPSLWERAVQGIYDNTSGLPTPLGSGYTYIAKVTAHGWIKDYIYMWTENAWRELTPSEGMITFNLLNHTLHAYIDVVGVKSWLTITHDPMTQFNQATAGEIAGLTPKSPATTADFLLIEDAAAGNAKKRITVADLPAAAPAAHAIDGALHTIGSLTNTYLVKNDGTKLVNASDTDTNVHDAVTKKHTQSHALDSTSDHTIGSLTSGNLIKSDGSKLAPATNTDSDVNSAVTLKHAQSHTFGGSDHSTDTIANVQGRLSSGKFITSASAEISTITEKTSSVYADLFLIEDSAASNVKKRIQVQNVTPWLWGTGDPPAAGGRIDGTLYFKYTA